MSEKLPAVFAHVHYPDVWAEMAVELAAAFDRPFALVITCRDPALEIALPETPHLARVHRVTAENRGRDVLPFIKAMAKTDFDIGLKLHTKRSIHREDGEAWRRFLVSSLLQRWEGQLEALALMEAEPRIGLVAPEAHLLRLGSRMVMNVRITRRLAAALGYDLPIKTLKAGRFAAGSMFWFRSEALARFADPRLDRLFAPERGQLDGTAGHAAERLFSAATEKEGLVATAMEAVGPLRTLTAERGRHVSIAELKAASEAAVAASVNPFALPLSAFWERHPLLLVAAHYAYQRTPPPIWQFARRIVRTASGRPAGGGAAG